MPTSRTATSAAMRSVMGRRSRSSHARCRSRARSSTAASARMSSITSCSVISRLRRVFLQELQHRDFVAPQRGGGVLAARAVRRDAGGERGGESLQVRAHEAGVDVVLAAHGAGVAEALRHGVDRADHVALGLALALRGSQQKKLPRREHRARPGPEVLRRDIPAGDLAKIRVDVVRRDRLALAGGVDVLEQLLPGKVLALLDDAREAPVGDRHRVIDSALAAEAEEQFRALDLDMALAQGGEAEGAVLARVLVVAHADQRLVEQHHHGGEDLATREIARAQIALHALADLGKGLAELEHAAELRLVARLAVQGMVAVLLAAARVARSEEHTSELQSRFDLVCRLLLEKKNKTSYFNSIQYEHSTQ